jgi:hypothetical protein
VTTPHDTTSRRAVASRAIRAGVLILACGVVLALLPLLLSLGGFDKYVVACGLIAILIGLGWFTNGAIDWVRARSL